MYNLILLRNIFELHSVKNNMRHTDGFVNLRVAGSVELVKLDKIELNGYLDATLKFKNGL